MWSVYPNQKKRDEILLHAETWPEVGEGDGEGNEVQRDRCIKELDALKSCLTSKEQSGATRVWEGAEKGENRREGWEMLLMGTGEQLVRELLLTFQTRSVSYG